MKRVITMIKLQKRRGRYNVYVNDRYAFPVSERVLVRYHLHRGQSLKPIQQKRLVAADQVAKFETRAIRFVAHRLRTVKEVREHLSAWGADPTVVQKVITRLADLRLINDQHYADCYVRSEDDRYGPVLIARLLRMKGITAVRVRRALRNYYPQDLVIKHGVQQANKLFRRHRAAFRNNLRKTKAGLIRKGYSFDDVASIMQRTHLTPDRNAQRRLLIDKARLAWRRYSRYATPVRRYRVKGYLYRQGFTVDEIDLVLENIVGKE